MARSLTTTRQERGDGLSSDAPGGSSSRSPTAATLRIPAEPVRLRGELRALIGSDPDAAPREIVRRLAPRLWRAWRARLVELGLTPALFAASVSAYRRETWLWAIGDRRWEQMVEGLAGRVLRRQQETGGPPASPRPPRARRATDVP